MRETHFFGVHHGRCERHDRFGGRGFFGRFGGFMGGGRGLRAARMLAAGDLQLVILSLLSEKPRHGYEIIKALEETSSGVYAPSPGMVYPALTYLEETEFAVSEIAGAKKLFKITPAGAEHLAANRAAVEQTLEDLKRYGRRMAEMQKQFADNEDSFGGLGSEPGADDRDAHRKLREEFHELKSELKAAMFEKRGAAFAEKKRVLEVLKRALAEIRGR